MPPTTGTASSSFSVDSATNCTATSGQLAAATSAPRFRVGFQSWQFDMRRPEAPVYLCGILLDECPLIDTPRARRSLAAAARGRRAAGRAGREPSAPGSSCAWFGPTDAAAARRVERDVHERASPRWSADHRGRPARVAHGCARGRRRSPPAGGRRPRALFDLVGADPCRERAARRNRHHDLRQGDRRPRLGRARRRTSRTTASPGPSTLFVTPSPLGLRLVHLQPIAGSDGPRLGSVAREHVLAPAPAATTLTPTDYTLPTSLGPASLRTRLEGAGDPARPGAVLLRAPSGEPLREAWVDPADPARRAQSLAPRRWRRSWSRCWPRRCCVLIGPLLDRRIGRDRRVYVRDDASGRWRLTALGGLLLWLAARRQRQQLPSTRGDAAARRRHGGRAREPARRSGRPPAGRVARTAALRARVLGRAHRHATRAPASASPR